MYKIIADTDGHLDSLKLEMDQMNEVDVNSPYKVKSIFLYNGAGDLWHPGALYQKGTMILGFK